MGWEVRWVDFSPILIVFRWVWCSADSLFLSGLCHKPSCTLGTDCGGTPREYYWGLFSLREFSVLEIVVSVTFGITIFQREPKGLWYSNLTQKSVCKYKKFIQQNFKIYMALTTYPSKLKMPNWSIGFKWLFFTKPKNWALNRRVDGLKSESPIQPSLHPCFPEVQ